MTDSGFGRLVTVFGGSGFVGRHVVRALARRRYRVRVAVRRPDLAGHLQPLGSVGQIHAVQANVRAPWSVERAIAGADAVVNLVGVRFGRGRQTFEAVNAEGPGAIAAAAAAAGVARLVHISAIGADPEGASAYARSKAAGEAAVKAFPDAAILRPSVAFGPEDFLFNTFAALARISPVLPLIGGGGTRFQPVFAGDIAEAVARLVDGTALPSTYELGGPEILTFREIIERVLAETGRSRLLMPLPWPLARLAAAFLTLAPRPLLTRDDVIQLRADSVVGAAAAADGRTLEGLGVTPTPLAAVLPDYLYRFRRGGQYDRRRTA